MFWSEIIRDKNKFCTCEGAWVSFKIVSATVSSSGFLEVYVTPEDGNRCLLLRMRSGETIPISQRFSFEPFQHVKFEVIGGDIVVVGEAVTGTMRYKNVNHFSRNCPFGDEDDWKFGEKLFKKIERTGNDEEDSAEEL